MADINPLGPSTYFSGIQNAASQQAKQASKNEKTKNTSKLKFSDIFTGKKEMSEAEKAGYPPEIQGLSTEDAAIFLKDRVDEAGDLLNQNLNNENVEKFKKAVQLFVRYVVDNNYEIKVKKQRGFITPVNHFSNYSLPNAPKNPRVMINTINKKLDELTRSMLYNQRDNIKILANANEIKGLIIDFLAS